VRLISPLLKHVIYPGISKIGYFRRSANVNPVVLTYHGILPSGYTVVDQMLDGNLLAAGKFREQLALLAKHYHVITPVDFLLWTKGKQELPENSVMLTCDDGLKNNLTDMLPILREFGVSCLFFVTGASLRDEPLMIWSDELFLMLHASTADVDFEFPNGRRIRARGWQQKRALWWPLVEHLSCFAFEQRLMLLAALEEHLGLPRGWNSIYHDDPRLSRRFLPMTPADLRELVAAGMVIGAHTLSHPVLSQLPTDDAFAEILRGRQGLSDLLGQEIWALAYPFGTACAVSSRETMMARSAGFSCAFMNTQSHLNDGNYAIPRVHIGGDRSLGEFEANLSGFHSRLRSVFALADAEVAPAI